MTILNYNNIIVRYFLLEKHTNNFICIKIKLKFIF